MPLPVCEKVFSAAERGFISETHENLRCLKNFPKTSAPNVSAPSTVVLMPMTITAIFLNTGNALSSAQKRTKMSFVTGRPVTSWKWRADIRGITTWISKIKAAEPFTVR